MRTHSARQPSGFVPLLKQEWFLLRRSPILWVALSLFAGAVAYGVYNGATYAARLAPAPRLAAQYNAAQPEVTRASLERLAKRPAVSGSAVVPWHSGIVAYELFPQAALLPQPLAAVSIGQSDLYPAVVQARTSLDSLRAEEEMENPNLLLTGPFDLAFVLVYALPLLVLALSYDCLSGDREAGILPLVLVQGASLSRLIAARLLLRGTVVIAVVYGTAMVCLVAMSGSISAPGFLSRSLLLALAITVYTGFWFALSFALGTGKRSSSANAIGLVGCWLILVLILPSVIQAGLEVFSSSPSRLELVQTVRGATDTADGKTVKLLQEQYRSNPAFAPQPPVVDAADIWTLRYVADEAVDRETAPLRARFDRASATQHQRARQASVLSPAIQMQNALSEIAGTSETRYERFQSQVDAFRLQWRQFFLPRIWKREGTPASEWTTLPKLSLSDESEVSLATHVLALLTVPILATVLLVGAGFHNLRRITVSGG